MENSYLGSTIYLTRHMLYIFPNKVTLTLRVSVHFDFLPWQKFSLQVQSMCGHWRRVKQGSLLLTFLYGYPPWRRCRKSSYLIFGSCFTIYMKLEKVFLWLVKLIKNEHLASLRTETRNVAWAHDVTVRAWALFLRNWRSFSWDSSALSNWRDGRFNVMSDGVLSTVGCWRRDANAILFLREVYLDLETLALTKRLKRYVGERSWRSFGNWNWITTDCLKIQRKYSY